MTKISTQLSYEIITKVVEFVILIQSMAFITQWIETHNFGNLLRLGISIKPICAKYIGFATKDLARFGMLLLVGK